MKFIITIIVAVLLSVAAATLLKPDAVQSSAKQTALQEILARGTLRCGYTSFEPMLIVDPNTKKISGIAHDVMEQIGDKLGVKIEWVEESGWAEFVTALNNKRFDMYCVGNWANAKRARNIAFTNPIAFSPVDVFVRADDARFDNNAVLLGNPNTKLVTIEGGTTNIIVAEQFPHAHLYQIPELSPISNLFIEVDTKKADAAIMDRATGANFMKANPGKVKRADGIVVRVFPNVYSLNQGEIELQQAVNQALRELQDAGIIDRIIKQYEPLPNSYFPVSSGYEAR